MSRLFIIVCMLFLGFLAIPYQAQTQQTGSIRGKVRAKDGPEISDVTVTAIEEKTRYSARATTNDSGDFEIHNLAVGNYIVAFEKEGFQKGKKRNVQVWANRTTEVNHYEMMYFLGSGGGDGLTGRELLSVALVAHGGAEYSGLQYVTARSSGFVNVAAVASTGATVVGGMVEIKLNVTDYQDRDLRRRLDIAPAGGLIAGPTFLVYTGTEGGGMISGNPFRVSEIAASRQWAMMGFGTLNRAVEGGLETALVQGHHKGNHYVVEVKFNRQDTVRYWVNKMSFLIDRVQTRYNSRVLVEEERSDYRKVSCMMFPFHVVTRLNGQRLADLTIDSYDLQTVVPSARFILTASE